jgi:hypothetical protein
VYAALSSLAFAGDAGATAFRRPFNESIALGYGYDHNGGAAGCTDYECGGTCYDGHRGSDFPTPYGTTIVAGAEGSVVFVSGGCADVGFLGSQCGGGYGNYVKIQHADGKTTYHAHLKDGSIAVSVGDHVSCGQKVGESASSGNSSGYHQHFEVRVGVAEDPYAGQCGGPASYWVSQGAYGQPPSAACETVCVCSPGQTESIGCGLCGTQTRTCGGDCQWGGFGGCGGEGPCSPGSVEKQPCGGCGEQSRTCGADCQWGGWGECGPPPCTPGQTESEVCGNCGTRARACEASCQWGGFSACSGEGPCSPGAVDVIGCGDCGEEARTCGGDCQWGAYGPCGGPDPGGGALACDTGLAGVCADGRVRCVLGLSTCLAASVAGEVCDGVDNDCDGDVDDGLPAEMGASPPAYAAALRDVSYPRALGAGERASAWATFENAGASTWLRGGLWLAPTGPREGAASALYAPGLWPAWDVAAVLDRDVAPGESARFSFPIVAPEGAGDVAEGFQLETSEGAWVACPTPGFELALSTWPVAAGGDSTPRGAPPVEVESGCAAGGPPRRNGGGLVVAAALLLLIRTGGSSRPPARPSRPRTPSCRTARTCGSPTPSSRRTR